MSKKTILAIDDETGVLEFYQTTLAGLGQVKIASSLSEARSQLNGVDLILLDFHLGHDKELMQEVIPELKKTAPVLLCSGIQDERVPVLGNTLGVAGYWNKAIGLPTLLELVKRALKN